MSKKLATTFATRQQKNPTLNAKIVLFRYYAVFRSVHFLTWHRCWWWTQNILETTQNNKNVWTVYILLMMAITFFLPVLFYFYVTYSRKYDNSCRCHYICMVFAFVCRDHPHEIVLINVGCLFSLCVSFTKYTLVNFSMTKLNYTKQLWEWAWEMCLVFAK